jgi:hypothetical protein
LDAGEIVNANFLLTLFDASSKGQQEAKRLVCPAERLCYGVGSKGVAQW